MDFTLTDEQKDLQTAAQQAFRRWLPRSVLNGGDSGFAAVAAEGWVGLLAPEAIGGSGLGLFEQVLVMEAAGQNLHGEYWPLTLLGAGPAARFGLWPEMLPSLAAGQVRAVTALYEVPDRFAPLQVRTLARPVGDGYALTGTKVMIPVADRADYLICPALLDGEFALFAVPSGQLRLRETRTPDLLRPHWDVELSEALVPQAGLLAKGPDAESYIVLLLSVATLGLSAEMVGAADTVLAATIQYVRERHQFGVPVGTFQAVKHRCADMKIAVESARSAVMYAALAFDRAAPNAGTLVSVAKEFCSRRLPAAVANGLHLHGGMGFTWEADVHLYYRRVLSAAAYMGDAQDHQNKISDLLLQQFKARRKPGASTVFAPG